MKQRSVAIPNRKNIQPLEFSSDSGRPNTENDIRRRAYELYEKRGRSEGHALDDWLQAEREMRNHRVAVA